MPTYDYQCRSCGSVTEVIHSMIEEGPSVCERCGGVLRRVLYPTGIIFKGSGFYRNDSRSAADKGSTSTGDKAAPSGDQAASSSSTEGSSSPPAGSTSAPKSSEKPSES